jgi:PTH1 family peptidyl-tRNA hydrolase
VDRPIIVLGLGNPGVRYRTTRHNLGFRVLDLLAASWRASFGTARDLKAWTAEVAIPSGRVVLAKPSTYMNRSGRAAVALCAHYEVDASGLLVVLDDADLELGRIRLRPGGGAGGHNGMRSTIDALRTDGIPRLRLGVRGPGREDADLSDYVLAPFGDDEEAVASALVDLGAEAVGAVLASGIESAMNVFNARSVATDEAEARPEEG